MITRIAKLLIESSDEVSGGTFEEIDAISANSTYYADISVACGVSYEYRVRAYRLTDDMTSLYSNIATATALDCSPNAPSSLIVSTVIGDESLYLQWTDNSNTETEFHIERSLSGTNTWEQVGTVATNVTTYTDTDVSLMCYTAYEYRVFAFRSSDNSSSDPSNIDSSTTSCSTVNAPTNLTGTSIDNSITLTWEDNSPDEDNFEVQRTISSVDNWSPAGIASANLPTFNDNTTVCGEHYQYRVYAQRNNIDSDPSNILPIQQICTPPTAPSQLRLRATPFAQAITLTWRDNSTNESNFSIERSVDGVSDWTQIAIVGENITTYDDTDQGLACYTPYYYRVRAYRQADNVYSDYSEQLSKSTWCKPSKVNNPHVPFTINASTSDISGVGGFPQPSCAPNMTNAYVIEFPEATTSEQWTVTTFGSSFDTVLSIWSFDGTFYTEISCNDDGTLDGTSSLVSSFPQGTRYMVVVGGKNHGLGNIKLNSAVIPTPTPTFTPTFTPIPPPTAIPNITTVGLYRDGMWLFRDSNSTGTADVAIQFGTNMGTDWQPLIGDWDGDGADGIGLYKDGRWFLRDVAGSGSSADYEFMFGNRGGSWQAVVGDWDGDGADSIGLYKDGIWMLKNTLSGGNPDYTFRFNPSGSATAIAVAGTGMMKRLIVLALYNNGTWFLSYSHRSKNDAKIFQYGPTDGTWLPIVGDWDKDGDDTIGVYKDGGWRLRNTNSRGNPDLGLTFGLEGAVPVAGYRGGEVALLAFASFSDNITSIAEPTVIPTVTPTNDINTMTPTDVASETTEEPSEVVIETPTAIDTATATPTNTLTATGTYTPTILPTATWSDTPTYKPSATLTIQPTVTDIPTLMPTATETPK